MIAEVVFDAPLPAPFSYRLPPGCAVCPGQRVLAPLRRTPRTGLVVALREGDDERLETVTRILDPAPLLSAMGLDVVRWIARESLAPIGATALALLPPPTDDPVPPIVEATGAAKPPEILIGAGREGRLLARLAATRDPALLLTADVEAAGRWARRIARIGAVVRLDSGAPDGARAAAWRALAGGRARLAVGTRSALLAPLPPEGLLVLVDEHEAAHRPPGPPRVHARDVLLERAARTGLDAVLTAATPSVEMWWRARHGRARLTTAPPGPWPTVVVADTRGVGRREALTPQLARALRETLAAGKRVFLGVSRLASTLGCDECGTILRCPTCGIALAWSPSGRTLICRLCGASQDVPGTCPGCQGRRLQPFGWGAERVEQAVRRRFGRARIARYEPDASRSRAGEARREAALAAEVVIGARGALRLFGPHSLGLAAFVALDQMLGFPDFRAAERAFGLLWAAAERVRPGGTLLLQSRNPDHYAIEAVAGQRLELFYDRELTFRQELGYPPFRRLAVIALRGGGPAGIDELAARVLAALRPSPVTTYPGPRRGRGQSIVVKGGPDLPAVLGTALGDLLRGRRGGRSSQGRGIMAVEMDPVEWPS